ncbi:O-antigen ligase family protein [Akkermansiaceae bacterium]|nr:O-antigen ligase family protein [Akkermansiaceae bacterium]MDB4633271.1 O-antigen ligase family protein [Akkermansiaceae bacterium]MDB4802185.1 O-antigen ligase family protein [Akkermansiaceae bacterium]
MIFLSLGAFLPADLIGRPSWRDELEALGVETGKLNVIQWRMALEYHAVYFFLAFAALWILGLRFSARATSQLALAFVMAVAFYAIVAKISENQLALNRGGETFGFFPNRNHNSNFLTLGFVCGLGAFFQAIRSKHFIRMAILLISNGVILWAVFSWNISRSGIVLCVLGPCLWFIGLGWRYFGKNELKAFALIILLGVGVFVLNQFGVKERLSGTVEKISETFGDENASVEETQAASLDDVDFRFPVAKDTLQLIGSFPLTGVGSGQFRWIFPQYRNCAIARTNEVAVHPESSWYWLAAEWGLPAALCLLVLVILIYVGGYRNIRKRGNRDRALRFGCLVASAMVPLHSLFDVPAHRPSLLLASLVLFVISQNHQAASELAPKKWSRALGVVVGLCLITIGVLFLGASSFGWRKPLIVQSAEDLAQGAELYKKIKEEANPLNPLQSLPMRKKVAEVAGQITRDVPLDGRLYRLRALASLPLVDLNKETAADFAIDRALIPFSIRIPRIHAAASLPYLDEEVAKGWQAALENADRIDEIKGETSRDRERVIGSIRSVVRQNPRFEAMALEVIGIEKFE